MSELSDAVMKIEGLAELAEKMTADSWNELRLFIRMGPSGCEVIVPRALIREIPGAYVKDGKLWVRNKNDELVMLG